MQKKHKKEEKTKKNIQKHLIMNGMYDVNKCNNIIFKLDDSSRRGRGHDQKLFKKRFILDAGEFAFISRVVNDWNSLSSQCVNCCTVNTFKNILSIELEPETANASCVLLVTVGIMAFKPVFARVSRVLDIAGIGEIGEKSK